MEVIDHTKHVLQLISDKFDMDYEDMYNYISLCCGFDKMMKHDKLLIPSPTSCCAFINNNNKLSLCSRSRHDCKSFCKTHQKLFDENKLRNGFYKNTINVIDVKKMTINNKEFFVQESTKKIYDIDTMLFKGYLKENDNGIISI